MSALHQAPRLVYGHRVGAVERGNHHNHHHYMPKEITILDELDQKSDKSGEVAGKVVKSPALLPELLVGLDNETGRIKLRAAKVLKIISEKNPATLYPNWEFFVNLLDSENNILRWIAIDVLANLTAIDHENKFERIFPKFFGLMSLGSLITAAHVVDNSACIIKNKPQFENQITDILLQVDKVKLPTAECRNILIGKAIEAFEQYFDQLERKDEARAFVEKQLNNSRPATKEKALEYINAHGKK
ncbi:MAG: hypothetical protein UW45_C0029G0011 [Parcubacteria group bacterium GW2011_GWC2_44_22]|nr:MAG: hypothetical protein UW45_C0029G0011 [Parcubacteria group bacterium GW2011_GWC2_44_22]